jgi:hypothetical protein
MKPPHRFDLAIIAKIELEGVTNPSSHFTPYTAVRLDFFTHVREQCRQAREKHEII